MADLNPLIAAFRGAPPAAAPALGTGIAMPGPAPDLGSSVLPSVSLAPPPPPTQTQKDQQRRSDLINSGSGVDQINNPLLRGIARAGDIAASVFAPRVAAALPGTTLHHNMMVDQATNNVAKDQAEEAGAAKTQQEQALAAQETAKAGQLSNPQKAGDPSKTVQTDDGVFQFNPDTQKYDTRVGDRVEKALTPEGAAYKALIDQGKGPLEAFSSLNQAKNTKDASLQQQYLDNLIKSNPTMPLTDAIAQTIHATSTQPKIEIKNAGGAGNGVPPSAPGQVSPLVQAIIDGRSPAPNSRSKAGMALMAQVTAADPTYDASRYNTYQAAQKEMTSGKTGANINALNTLINHINDARQHLPDNGSFSPINAITNTGGTLIGKNPTGKFDTDAVGIGGEFGKLVSGGVATVDEQKHLQKLLDHNASPNTLRDNLDEIENLAHGKLEGIYKQVQSSAHPGPGSNIPTSLPAAGGQAFTDGGTTYHIPADQVAAFKKDHPNAR